MKKIWHTTDQERKVKNLLCFLIGKTNSGEIYWQDNTGWPFLEQGYYSEYNNAYIELFIPDQNHYGEQKNGYGIKINKKIIIMFDQGFPWKETEIGFKLNELLGCVWESVKQYDELEMLSEEGEKELNNLYKTMLIEDIADI